MKTLSIVKACLGGGAAILLGGMLAAAPAAQASTGKAVPCKPAALIAAISAANSRGGGTINLAPGCTYRLTTVNNSNPTNPIVGANGLPVITTPVTINGAHTTIARSSSAPSFRLFEVDGPGGSLKLNNLTLTGGSSPAGGALLNAEGAVTLNHSRVIGNTAAMGGGGLASGVIDPNGVGPIGTLTLNFSQVTGNTALSGGGGGLLNHAGTATLNFSQVTGNTSGGGGGGIASGPGNGGTAGSSTLVLAGSQVNHNTSTGGPMAGAGGIANGGVATITGSQVNENTAPGAPGGGILNHGTMTITGSQVNGNTAPTDSSGDLGDGGGIANINFDLVLGVPNPPPSGVLTIIGSQVNGNSASGLGGGIADVGINTDGTPTAPAGTLTLKFVLVTGNTAGVDGGGLYTSPGSPVSFKASLIIKNKPDNCVPLGGITGCSH
jgi:hypothetical protein